MSRKKRAIKTANDNIYIFDEIGNQGILAKTFIKELNDIEESTVPVRINSTGGSVFEGMAIYNAIKEDKRKTIIYIDGIAAGMASIVAMAGDKILMHKDAFLMIKNPTIIRLHSGESASPEDELEKIIDNFIKIYTDNSNKSEIEIREMMADEKWFNAKEALEAGLIDKIYGKEKS